MNKLRINILSGAGAGKSTLAAKIFTELKHSHYNTELVTEAVKIKAYKKEPIIPFEQVILFAQQMYAEEVLLHHGVDIIVSDSPVWLAVIYASIKTDYYVSLGNIAKFFDKTYPSLNLLIERTVPYTQFGRYKDKANAIEIDDLIKNYLDEHRIPYYNVNVESSIVYEGADGKQEDLMVFVKRKINKS